MNYKVAILDDEFHCVESLSLHLKELFPELEIVYESTKVRTALDYLKDNKIDLLFLDIEMPGMNGFEFLENFPDRDFDIIFTTAYSQYALKAFKAKAVSYLLKPIDEEELKEVLSDWLETQKEENTFSGGKIKELLEHLKREGFMKSKISVPVANGYQFVEIREIVYCQSHNNYTSVYLADGTEILVSKTMKKVAESLTPFFFIRIHQSYIINPKYLDKYIRKDGGYVVMANKKELPVSNSKKDLILNLFEMMSGNQG